MSLACLAHVNFLLHMYFDLITEQINDDDDDEKNCIYGKVRTIHINEIKQTVTVVLIYRITKNSRHQSQCISFVYNFTITYI